MQILRTRPEALDELPDYPFGSRFVSVRADPAGDPEQTLRIHYVETGPGNGRPVVFLHGNPGWSYVWRQMLPAVAALGHRAMAFDLVGMGLSDRPAALDDYTVQRHVDWLREALFDRLELRDAVFVLQDWGGILGLRLIALEPERVAGVVASNTGLPERDPAKPLPEGPIEASGPFAQFQKSARDAKHWEPWNLLPMVIVEPVSDALREAYRAPYREVPAVGSQAFPLLLPTRPDNPMLPDNFAAWKVLERYERPFVTIYSDRDIIAPEGWRALVERIPGARDQPHAILQGGGHFLQEDIPEAYTSALTDWLRAHFPA